MDIGRIFVLRGSYERGLAFAMALAFFAPPASTFQKRYPIQTDSIFENGLRVTVLENHDVPLVTVLLAVRAGAFTQRPGEEGLSHLHEHVLLRSYGNDPAEFAEAAGRLNAMYNGTTGADVVTYYLILPSEETEDAIRLMARLITKARVRDRDLEQELPVVLGELAHEHSNPVGAMSRQVSRKLWAEDWHRIDVLGDSASLRQITVDQLQEHFDRYYVPNNAALIVTGDAHPERVFEYAGDSFDDWEKGENPFADSNRHSFEPLSGRTAVLALENVLEVTVQVQIRAPGLGEDEDAVHDIEALVELLNHPTGELQKTLVTNGPLQFLVASLIERREASEIVFVATSSIGEALAGVPTLLISLDQLDLAVQALGYPSHEVEQVALEGVIESLANRWELDLALTTERTARLAPYVAELWGNGGGEYLYDRSPFEVARSAEDFAAIAREYVCSQPKAIGILAPPSLLEQLRSILGGGAR
jgi:zinc protease